MPDGSPKQCFVVSPIGRDGSAERKRADQVLRHIIRPAVEECGYKAVRADEISHPGQITTQIIQELQSADLVVADLSGHNPNVFYELAIRHATRKPVVQIIDAEGTLPFDVLTQRTISFDYRDLDSAAACREAIVEQIRAVEEDCSLVDNPVSVAIDLGPFKSSEDSRERMLFGILEQLRELRSHVQALKQPSKYPPTWNHLASVAASLGIHSEDGLRRFRNYVAHYQRSLALRRDAAPLDDLLDIKEESKEDVSGEITH